VTAPLRSIHRGLVAFVLAAGVLALASSRPAAAEGDKGSGPAGAQPAPQAEAPAGLAIGDKAPDVTLADAAGKPVKLSELWARQPVVLTFYRGGWCPFCNQALAAWQEKLPELDKAGAVLVALTPEKSSYATQTVEKHKLTYRVLSDSKYEAAKSYKTLFEMDKGTQEKYKGYGVDLGEHNAAGTWELPVPATYVIDTAGVVRWVHFNPDYRKRADPGEVIKAVGALKQ